MAIKRFTVKEIHAALDASGGNISQAAYLIGCTTATVKKAMDENPELQSYLPNAPVPGEAESLVKANPLPSRVPVRIPKATPEEVNDAVNKLEGIFTKSLQRCGINAAEAKQVVALQALGHNHFTQLRNFLSGSTVELYLDLRREYKAINDALQNFGEGGDAEYEKGLREDRGRIVTAMIQVMDRVDKSLLTAALVEAKKAERKDSKGAKFGKPGFGPMMGQKVEITTTGPVTVAPKPECLSLANPEV